MLTRTTIISCRLLTVTLQYESTRVFVILFCLCCVLTYATAAANIFEVHGAQLQSMTTTSVMALAASPDDQKSSVDTGIIKIEDGDDGDDDGDTSGGSMAMAVALARVSFVLKGLERQGLVDHERDIEPLIALFNQEQHQATVTDTDNSTRDAAAVYTTEGGSSDSLYGPHSPPSSSASTMIPSLLRDHHSITAITSSTASNPMHHPPQSLATTKTTTTTAISTA